MDTTTYSKRILNAVMDKVDGYSLSASTKLAARHLTRYYLIFSEQEGLPRWKMNEETLRRAIHFCTNLLPSSLSVSERNELLKPGQRDYFEAGRYLLAGLGDVLEESKH